MIEYDFCCFFGKEIKPTLSVLKVSTWLTSMERSKKSMSIGREDLDSRRVDFSGVTSGRRLPPSAQNGRYQNRTDHLLQVRTVYLFLTQTGTSCVRDQIQVGLGLGDFRTFVPKGA